MSVFHKHDTQVEETIEVGTAEDVEKLMRKYDRESNTRIWAPCSAWPPWRSG